MPNTTSFDFGDVVLVPFPFTDQSTIKKRPAVVVSSAAYHSRHSDVVLMAITSRLRPVNPVAEIAVQHWQDAGLIKPSVFKPLLATIDRHLVIRTLGKLHPADLAALRKAINEIFG